MTHLSPDGEAVPRPSASLSQQALTRPQAARSALPHPLSGQTLLTRRIASRRAHLTQLEIEMIAACEAAALRPRSRTNTTDGREHWGPTTWHRYLAAAMRLEVTYGPRMRRLRQEIAQLERLKTLLTAV